MSEWSESDSSDFVNYGDLFVPNRKQQFKVFNTVLASVKPLRHVVDLSSGEGRLAQNILAQFPECKVGGYDISEVMLKTSQERNEAYKDRYYTRQFDITKSDWREDLENVDAVVSSLAIHHLDDSEKEVLFKDLYDKINSGGALVILDIVKPSRQVGFDAASDMWDEDVRTRSKEAGRPEAYERFNAAYWNYFAHPDLDPIDKPSLLLDQLKWMEQAGFKNVDVFWMFAGHALYAGWK